MSKPIVSIVMGSDSDLEIMREAGKALDEFGIAYEMDVTSAHRSPDRTADYARKAAQRGVRVIIAGAGGAAHLAGVIAAHTTLPVIGRRGHREETQSAQRKTRARRGREIEKAAIVTGAVMPFCSTQSRSQLQGFQIRAELLAQIGAL